MMFHVLLTSHLFLLFQFHSLGVTDQTYHLRLVFVMMLHVLLTSHLFLLFQFHSLGVTDQTEFLSFSF